MLSVLIQALKAASGNNEHRLSDCLVVDTRREAHFVMMQKSMALPRKRNQVIKGDPDPGSKKIDEQLKRR